MVACRGQCWRCYRRRAQTQPVRTRPAGPLVSETLAPEPASVGRARRLVTAALAAAGYDEDVADVVTLLVSEVVTNALLHAGTAIGLRCQRRGAGVRVEVFDRSAMCRASATTTLMRPPGVAWLWRPPWRAHGA